MRRSASCALVGVACGVSGLALADGCPGDQIFSDTPIVIDTSVDISALISCDVDGDGRRDIAFAGVRDMDPLNLEYFVGVVEQASSGGFFSPVYSQVADPIRSLWTADFDGDGRDEIIYAGDSDLPLSCYSPFGHAPVDLGLGAGSDGLVVADLDGDGFTDVSKLVGGERRVRRGGPSGLGPSRMIFALQGDLNGQPVVGDVNEDGYLDMIEVDSFSVRVLLGTPDEDVFLYREQLIPEALTPSVGSIALGDLNGDERLDFFQPLFGTCRGARVGLGDGVGGFDVSELAGVPIGTTSRSSVVDMNADGAADVVYLDKLFLGDGQGGLAAVGEPCSAVTSLDRSVVLEANNDGRPDLATVSVFATGRSTIFVWLNECGPVACPADIADRDGELDADGLVTLGDFSAYLNLWTLDSPDADVTTAGACDIGFGGDGVDLSDFVCYLSAWSLGCP